jgi:hypothetical protein
MSLPDRLVSRNGVFLIGAIRPLMGALLSPRRAFQWMLWGEEFVFSAD